MTRQRTKGYTWNQQIVELRHAHATIHRVLDDILRYPDMSRGLRAEKVARAAQELFNAQEAIKGLESIAEQTHDELTTLESKLQRVK